MWLPTLPTRNTTSHPSVAAVSRSPFTFTLFPLILLASTLSINNESMPPKKTKAAGSEPAPTITRAAVRKAGTNLAQVEDNPERFLRANGKRMPVTLAEKNERVDRQRVGESQAEKQAREKGLRITEGRE